MSRQFTAKGIVLTRTNYGEADRIITFLTPTHGKVSALAKAVRKSTSKLAGGIELFSVSELTFIEGKSSVNTLISSRLITHYGNIVKSLERTNLGYELIKVLHKNTEDNTEAAYFNLLNQAFQALDDPAINLDLIKVWFQAQLLKLAGHTPNLTTDSSGQKLKAQDSYTFDFNTMHFKDAADGSLTADHIKFLRLVFGNNTPNSLQKINGYKSFMPSCLALLNNAFANTLH